MLTIPIGVDGHAERQPQKYGTNLTQFELRGK